MGLIVALAIIALVVFISLVIKGITNQPVVDPFAEYNAVLEERQERLGIDEAVERDLAKAN